MTRASDGKILPLRPLLEDHITQDFGRIPTLAVCFAQLAPESLDPDVTVYDHCRASAKEFGGAWSDYQALHQFLDWPRDALPDGRFRRVLHNSWGVGLAEQAFGLAFRRASDGSRTSRAPDRGAAYPARDGNDPDAGRRAGGRHAAALDV